MISLTSVTPPTTPFAMASARQTKSFERLASGLRLNRAADDSAGFAITSTLNAQLRGNHQAQANSQDGINLLRTLDGGLSKTHEQLHRMRELLVQANNDTYTAEDRLKIQEEFAQIIEGIDETALNTQFNGKILLRRLLETTTTVANFSVTVPPNGATTVAFGIPTGAFSTSITADFSGPFGLGNPFPDLNVTFADGTVFGSQALDGTAPPPALINGNTGSVGLVAPDPLLNGNADAYSYSGVNTPVESMTFTAPVPGNHSFTIDNNSPAVGGAPPVTPGGTFNVTVATNALVTESNGLQDARSPYAVYLQLGGNEGQIVRHELPDASAFGLALLGIDVTRIDSPGVSTRDAVVTDYFQRIDAAIASVSTSRAKAGAMENRLSHNLDNLGVASGAMSASTSRIRDVDVALESANLVKSQIQVQAGASLLLQSQDITRGIIRGLIDTS